ncbi:MAG: hypothetical protein ACYDBJ_03980, partial [Aggregatilineales bacterium]
MTRRKLTTAMALTVFVLLASTAGVYARPVAQNAPPPITIWTKFNDQNPQNSQDQWLQAFLKEYSDKTGGKVTNVFQPFDQINSKLNLAVQSGGDLPDLSYVDTQEV